MGFWNSLFGKKEVKVELPKEEEKELLPSVDKEINERLDSIDLDIESLALDKIRSEAEAISSYLKGLMQDINKYSNLMDKKEMQKQIIKSITGKIKVITQHSLELKNLIAHVEQRYHDYLLENFKWVNEKKENEDIKNLIKELEEDKETIKALDTKLTRIIYYDEIFNPDKNKEYEGNIHKEVEKMEIHTNINDLTTHLLNGVLDKVNGIISRIQKKDYLGLVKEITGIKR
ncbi:hypothetical protein J4476_03250 [Candidatus Woesearchaeota archaeon]|nr:MAG: hypothetical protein QT09_C0006G0039 [archaeon GW2011_AR18]MBS3161685.1 hypothetical protein [Candidatus Woesearchaeota archaeon]HIH25695.1 hypothetical protein [Nanoarchaeota archaeon]